jgi:hypothetical protein
MASRANLLVCMVLGTLACGSDREAQQGPTPIAAVAAPPSATEVEAYARGAAVEVRLVRRALQAGDSIRWAEVDSAGAAAVGMTVERFRAVSAVVEATLKNARQLDSLRIELMVLRVRAEGTP